MLYNMKEGLEDELREDIQRWYEWNVVGLK